MCVIIYVPKESTISLEELQEAWITNPHGAGFSIQENNKVYFKRGFMEFADYYEAIKNYIGVKNLLLHFRISTSKKINRVQTHPYKKGDISLTEGVTSNPVICMNGIISGQKEYKDCNDTMSYIIDHQQAFANINQDILNIIEEASGAKWAVMKPDEVLLSSKFEEEDGRYYSNKNHLITRYYYGYYNGKKSKKSSRKTFEKMIKTKRLRNAIKRNNRLYYDVLDFLDYWCNGNHKNCNYCTKCLATANTLRDVKIVLAENFYGLDLKDEEDAKEAEYCFVDYDDPYAYYDDIYDYGNDKKYDDNYGPLSIEGEPSYFNIFDE